MRLHMKNYKKIIPGVIFVLIISIISILINDSLKSYINLEALTIAIILGIAYNNTVGTQDVFKGGIKFSLKKLLKVGIVLLGFNLNIKEVLNLGLKILVMVLIYVPTALILSYVLGKIFKVDKKLSTLIGVGSCICGASAIVAMTPCINASDDDSVVAVSIVSFLGAIGVLIYSAVAVSGLNLTPIQYGIWAGISLHGVAHALAAAFALGNVSGQIGTIVKMTRVIMLVPVSIILGLIFARVDDKQSQDSIGVYDEKYKYSKKSDIIKAGRADEIAAGQAMKTRKLGQINQASEVGQAKKVEVGQAGQSNEANKQNREGQARKERKAKKAKFPMYVIYFILAGIINSLGIIPASITSLFVHVSSILILMAMTAMGLSVHFKSIVNKGIKAMIIGTILFSILSTGSLLAII
ncbi:hypothetical protein CLTEP_20210 [Clostridium tepidiprofundi DSM 19306]|uniref:Sulfate exporter family transporter n=1 Tax=Clostridium tepidiprofundi DSM 19306 TaxID=1121338 RepID=A0A151B2J3_9CLOT|nr:putative sulfate exporter family transporter [Clostridium tepidiprofundi]KYH34020.1 hypothetical protein CLTEP_20210 [Clostridium tepidiprofundi DSM 19306]